MNIHILLIWLAMIFPFFPFFAAEAFLLGFQHYILMLGTTVMIPTLLVPQMGGTDVSLLIPFLPELCRYACMHACMYVCMYVCVCMSGRMYVCMYVCVCLGVCMYVCIIVYMYMYVWHPFLPELYVWACIHICICRYTKTFVHLKGVTSIS